MLPINGNEIEVANKFGNIYKVHLENGKIYWDNFTV